jgi:hypothetical protein
MNRRFAIVRVPSRHYASTTPWGRCDLCCRLDTAGVTLVWRRLARPSLIILHRVRAHGRLRRFTLTQGRFCLDIAFHLVFRVRDFKELPAL